MHELAEWGPPTLVRAALAAVVAMLLVATCIKWLRLRSPDGEQWAWLLLIVQGAMFASLTVFSPTDWIPSPPAQPVPASNMPVPVDGAPQFSRRPPKAVPLRLDVPEHRFDRGRMPFDVRLDRPHHHGHIARLP